MSKYQNKTTVQSRVSLQRNQYRILDTSTRNRRLRQMLESLERDNFHEDPHANLVMHKKAPKFEDKNNKFGLSSGSTGRRYNLPRSRLLSLNALIEEDSKNPAPNYLSLNARSLGDKPPTANCAPNPHIPNIQTPVVQRHFCSICGFKGIYTCVICGFRYCSIDCQQIHKETRCLKWT
ncbi:Zinc finger HIT domain-containing protein 1 [Blomia tropicalis]|nr:Zinc finger HIT domain-containing protein 1 [Blomia tropicalis]